MLKNASRLLREKIKEVKRIRDLQKQSISDEYMVGLYNGLELACAILENREPIFEIYEQEIKTKQSSETNQKVGRTVFSGVRKVGSK